MGRYEFREQESMKKRDVHPAWRGIGCLLVVIIPSLSYLGATILLTIPSVARIVPPKLFGRPTLPDFFWNYPPLYGIASGLYKMNNLGANLFIATMLTMLVSGVIAVLYAATYRAVGPKRYRKPNVPPTRRKPRKYKR